jgi:putative transposase
MTPENSPPRKRFKTCKRFNDVGHAHAINFCCFHGQRFLASDRCCQWLAEAIGNARKSHVFDLWAYVFMPDHVHLLIWPRRPDYSISKILAAIKLPVSRKAIAYVRQTAPAFLNRMLDESNQGVSMHRFWQRGGGFDRNLWNENAVAAEIDYIHANPVRKQLCEKPEDWPWSSAADYAGLRQGPLAIDFHSLPRVVHIEPQQRPKPPR